MSTISLSSPTMSDKTLLLSVEDLISIAMGPREGNTVNFKMIQTVLHILARQMRVLEQKVVLVAGELPEPRPASSRGRRRPSKGDVDEVYRRPTPPEFKTEEERIAWEDEQDEIERTWEKEQEKQLSRSKKGQQAGFMDEDEEGHARPGGGGKGRLQKSAVGDDDDEPGRARSGGRGRERYDDDRGGRGGTGRRDADGAEIERDRSGGGRGSADAQDEWGPEGTAGGRESTAGGRDSTAGGRRRESSTAGGRGPGRYDDDDESSDAVAGRDTDKLQPGRGRSAGPGGRYSDDDETGGRGRPGGGRDGYDEKGGRVRPGGALEGADDEGPDRGGRGGAGRDGRGKEDARGKQGIGVREIEGPGKEKLLVVEKGPTTVGAARDRDSIAVVTQSQFHLLEAQVEELMRAAGPLPPLTMPDNERLRQDLAAGASLTDAMQAMQVSARVQAAEQAIIKLGALLTQLAASGALPPDAAGAVMAGGWTDDEEAQVLKSTSSGTGYKSMTLDAAAKDSKTHGGTSVLSKESGFQLGKFVTKPEMGTALAKLREEVTKTLQTQVDKATTAAETAEKTAKTVGDKIEELMKMDTRLTALNAMVEDYTEQLNGFDAGLTTQMESFKEQMGTMRAELQGGLEQLEQGNSNPETAAVMELNERFEGLVRGLDDTLLQHTALSNMQHQLTQELKTLVQGVEILREQKADRDELLDILRDKADISMLEGLVRQEEFDRAQADLEQRLDRCNDKFRRQDEVWMEAMSDLRELADTKAQLTDLLKIRDEATAQLRSIDDRINRLALILGEPKAALLMRKLARDAVCGACLAPAMMSPGRAPQPPALPAAHAPGVPAPPCAPEPSGPDYPDFRTHRCHRWVGGSHTLLPPGRIHASPIDLPDVTKKYTGYGDDGRLYWMETPMEACVECNPEPAPAPPSTARGGGDAGDAADPCEC